MVDAQQVGVFMTPEYLEGFEERLSERLCGKLADRFKRAEEECMNPEQAAKHLKISIAHLLKMARKNIIPGHKNE